MIAKVRATREEVTENEYVNWDIACGTAVRLALGGAQRVVVTDIDGAEYDVWAQPVEDNS